MKSSYRIFTYSILNLIILQLCLSQKSPQKEVREWTSSFGSEQCQFTTTGENGYFILKPSYQLFFAGVEGKDTTTLVVTVLDKTIKIGNVETRVVEERESVNSTIVEVSRNYYAICTQTNTVFYFGEDVDMFKNGKPAGHGGSWRVGSEGARAGVMIPGIPLLGSRYYQEIAPSTAMDRAEIVSVNESVQTPAAKFINCLKIEETTPLEPKAKEYKWYAAGIGLVKDGDLVLTKRGYK